MYYDVKASGLRIHQSRKAAGFTLEELSDRLNVSDRQLRRIEKGESSGSVDLLVEISCVLGTSLDYLLKVKAANTGDARSLLIQAASYLSTLADQV